MANVSYYRSNFKIVDSAQKLRLSNIQSNDEININDEFLKQIKGGGIPNLDELAFIIAYRNTAPSRAMAGAIVRGEDTEINVAVINANDVTLNQEIV